MSLAWGCRALARIMECCPLRFFNSFSWQFVHYIMNRKRWANCRVAKYRRMDLHSRCLGSSAVTKLDRMNCKRIILPCSKILHLSVGLLRSPRLEFNTVVSLKVKNVQISLAIRFCAGASISDKDGNQLLAVQKSAGAASEIIEREVLYHSGFGAFLPSLAIWCQPRSGKVEERYQRETGSVSGIPIPATLLSRTILMKWTFQIYRALSGKLLYKLQQADPADFGASWWPYAPYDTLYIASCLGIWVSWYIVYGFIYLSFTIFVLTNSMSSALCVGWW